MTPDATFNPYQVLALEKGCSEKEIQKAYKIQCLKWHPDKNLDNKEEAERRFIAAKKAFEFLFDKERRHEFDNKVEKRRAREEQHRARMEKSDGERRKFINELERREREFAEKKNEYRPSKTAEEGAAKYREQQRKAQEAKVRSEFEEIRRRLEREADEEIHAQQERMRQAREIELQKEQDESAKLLVKWTCGIDGQDYDTEQLKLIFKEYGSISEVSSILIKKEQRKCVIEFEAGKASWGAETESGHGGPILKAKWMIPPRETEKIEAYDKGKKIKRESEFDGMSFEELQAKLLGDIVMDPPEKKKKWHEEED